MSIFSSFFGFVDKIYENQEIKAQDEKTKDEIIKIRNVLNIRNINNDINNNDEIIKKIVGENGVSKILSTFVTNYMNEPSNTNNDVNDLFFCECSEDIQKNKSECVVCIEDIKEFDIIFLTKCNHIYHKSCIMKWLENNKTCPTCRCDINSLD